MLLLRKAVRKPHDVITAYGTVVPSTIAKPMKEYEILSKQQLFTNEGTANWIAAHQICIVQSTWKTCNQNICSIKTGIVVKEATLTFFLVSAKEQCAS